MLHRALAAASLLALVASGCVSDESVSGNEPTPSEVIAAESAGESVSTVGDDDNAVPIRSAGGSVDDFCAAISAIRAADFELEETFGVQARTLFDDVQSAAPEAIADDVATVVKALDAIAEIGISADEDDPASVDAAFEILLDPAFTEANENLADYTARTCGIDLTEGSADEIDLADLAELDG